MTPTMCSRCGKNVAVVFITKIENGQTKNEGLCLKCARELHIKPVDDVIEKMGISDEDLDSLSGDMMNALSGAEELLPTDDDGSEDDDGKTATFPFLNRLFGGPKQDGPQSGAPKAEGKDAPRPGKHKFLDSYCIDLTQRAKEGKLDTMIGRAEELERVIQILVGDAHLFDHVVDGLDMQLTRALEAQALVFRLSVFYFGDKDYRHVLAAAGAHGRLHRVPSLGS